MDDFRREQLRLTCEVQQREEVPLERISRRDTEKFSSIGTNHRSSLSRGRSIQGCWSCLDFIRVEGFVFSHVADEGIINACAGDLLRYRKLVGAENIQIFADIKKKHSAHALTADISVAETASAAELFLADGVVLTGTATGLPADPGELREVQRAVKIPVLIGSGVTLENVKNYLDANALIIGSYFKREGYWANGVDPDRVKKFMEHISKLRE